MHSVVEMPFLTVTAVLRILNTGHAVGQLIEAQRYKPEGRGFDSRLCHWNFSLTYYFRPNYMVLGSTQPLTEMSTRNILTTLSWNLGGRNLLERSGPVQACKGIALPLQYITRILSMADLNNLMLKKDRILINRRCNFLTHNENETVKVVCSCT